MENMEKVKTKKKKHKRIEYGRYGYMFIAPFFIVYIAFQLWPLIYTIWLSFMENYSRGLNVVGPNFIGLKNYLTVFVETTKNYEIAEGAKFFNTFTFKALGNTLFIWLFNFVPQILLSLILAIWLTDARVKLKGQGAFKIMIYMPNIITAATISVLFYTLFNNAGPITMILRDMGIIGTKYDFMSSKTATRLIISFIQFWMWYGNTMILLIAGVLGINPDLFEAARVDGASSRQIVRKITIPLLKPIILYVLVTSAIGGLQMYDIPALFNINNNGDALPDYASMTITMYIRKLGFISADLGKAAAVSMVLFGVTLIISLLFFFIMRDKNTDKPKKFKVKGAA